LEGDNSLSEYNVEEVLKEEIKKFSKFTGIDDVKQDVLYLKRNADCITSLRS
jgi:hypothetical protein